MLKELARQAIGLYLLPLKKSERLSYYARGIFTNPSEHLYSATRYISKHTKILDDEIIIDIGGANGDTSLYFANAFPGLQVYCVEPNARMLPFLKEVESKNDRVTVKAMALGRVSGEAVLHVTANDFSSSLNELSLEELKKTAPDFQAKLEEKQQLKVHVSTLDTEFGDGPNVLLMKMDTQGTELDILKGGETTLKKTRFILAEMNNHQIYNHTCQYYEMDEFLRNRSFKLADVVVTYKGDDGVTEYDALYRNTSL